MTTLMDVMEDERVHAITWELADRGYSNEARRDAVSKIMALGYSKEDADDTVDAECQYAAEDGGERTP